MKKQLSLGYHKLFGALWVLVLLMCSVTAQAADKQAIGWLEEVRIGEADMVFKAKVDTGADNTSIKANVLKKFSRDGSEWVRFRLANKSGGTAVLERKVLRYAKIKRKMAPSIKRPVVKLGICLGSVYRDVEINLAERKKFKYHMLIGRSFLRGFYLVDSELQYTLQPSCSGIKGG